MPNSDDDQGQAAGVTAAPADAPRDPAGPTPPAAASRPERRPTLTALTGLRFLAAFFVFLFHANEKGPQMVGLLPGGQGDPLWRQVFGQGFAGVPFFFVLSGFILAYNYRDRLAGLRAGELWRFAVARLARIYPVQVVTFAAAALLIVLQHRIVGGLAWAQAGVGVLTQVTLTQSLVPYSEEHTMFNGPAWSLSDEATFYAVFPFVLFALVTMWRLAPRHLMQLAAVAIAVLTLRTAATPALSDARWRLHTYPLYAFVLFLVGMCIGLAYLAKVDAARAADAQPSRAGGRWSTRLRATMGEVAVLVVVAGSVVVAARVRYEYTWTTWYVPSMALAIWCFAHGRGLLSSLLSTRAAVYLGELSYAFYMWHKIVLDNLNNRWGLHDLSLAVVTFVVTIALCVATYHLVEVPWRRRIRAWGERRAAAHAERRHWGVDGEEVGAGEEGAAARPAPVPEAAASLVDDGGRGAHALAGLLALLAVLVATGVAAMPGVASMRPASVSDGAPLAEQLLGQWFLAAPLALIAIAYLLTMAWQRRLRTPTVRDVARYGVRRVAALYPLHLITLVVALAATVATGGVGDGVPHLLSAVLAQLALTSAWVPYGAESVGFNPASIVVSTLAVLCIVHPVLVWLLAGVLRLTRRGLAAASAVSVALLVMRAMSVGDDPADVWLLASYPTFTVVPFLIGTCLALASSAGLPRRPRPRPVATLSELAALVALGASVVLVVTLPIPPAVTQTVWYLPAGALLVATLARGDGLVAAVLGARPLGPATRLAFPFTMWAVLVLALTDTHASSLAHRSAIALSIALVLAIVSHHLVERPARRRLRAAGDAWVDARFPPPGHAAPDAGAFTRAHARV